MDQQGYIAQLENENRQLKAQLMQSNGWLQGSLETNFIPKDLKLLTELEHLEALGNNFPNGCLFRLLVDADILESTNAKDILNKHLQLIYLSPSWEQISNIPRDVVMMDFTVFLNIIHPDDQIKLIPIIRKSLADCTLFNTELRYCYSDVETRWLQISTQPRHGGSYVECDGFLLDITERKESEQKLITEKKRLQNFGNNIPNGAYFQFIVNIQTGQMSMAQLSDTWTEITGISVAAALADISNIFATVHPEDLPHLIQNIEKSAQTLCEMNCEVRVSNHHHKTRWIQIASRPYLDKEFVVGDGIVFDITDYKTNEIELAIHRNELELLVEKRTEELTSANEELMTVNEEMAAISEELENKMSQLKDSETKMRNFIQQSFEGILIFDDQGRITEWNRTIEEITGLEKKDTIGKYEWDLRWQLYLEEERTQQSLDNLRRSRLEYMAMNGDQEPILEDSLYLRNGEVRYFHGSLFPIKMKDTCYFCRIVSDITQKWQNEMELNRYRTNLEHMVEEKTYELSIAKEKAEESNRLKSSFLANMSHEVRTPLNAISGLLNILANDSNLSDAIRDYIDLINKNSEQLLRLIDDILDVAKIEAGQMNIRQEPVYINELMDELYIIYKKILHTAEKSYITLENVKSAKFDNYAIYADPVRLKQIIQNLLNNAVKFTEYGHIRFGYQPMRTNMLEFFVEDTGIGISRNQQEEIFQSFRQSELTNHRRYGGAGLGLTLSRSLAQLMGGDMQVSSIVGRGSKFTFTIEYNPCEKV